MKHFNLRVGIPLGMGVLLVLAAFSVAQLGNAGAQQTFDRSKLTPQAYLVQVANDESHPTPTNTPVPDATATNTPKPTQTGGATNTATSSPTVTQTPSPTKTPGPGTPTATATNTAVPTNTPTATSSPTATNTPVPGSTNTPTPTNTPVTPTATSTPVTPTATPTNTPVSTGPVLYAISPNEIGTGETSSFSLNGIRFTSDSSVELRNVTAGGSFSPINSSFVNYSNPNTIWISNFSFSPAGMYEVRVVNSNGTSNAVSITVNPSSCQAVGEGFYNLGASNNAPPNIKTLYTSHQVPCPGDMVTVRVGIDPDTPAVTVTFQFVMNGCLAENPMTEVSPNTWEATVQYNGIKPISFGYRPNATNAAGNTSYSKISTLGAPFWGCE